MKKEYIHKLVYEAFNGIVDTTVLKYYKNMTN